VLAKKRNNGKLKSAPGEPSANTYSSSPCSGFSPVARAGVIYSSIAVPKLPRLKGIIGVSS
jgi:hypothetical protein